jgi:hypothetical protein
MSLRSFMLATAVATLCTHPLHAQATQQAKPMWGPAPAVFPAGARLMVLAGDPGKPGEYTVRLEMPDGYRVAPHWHPTDENVTVISGTFLVGMGDTLKTTGLMSLPAGGFVVAGATMHHFAIAKGKTVVQVHGIGPFALTYVNPADDPTRVATHR